MSKYLGDYATSTVIYGKFTTYRPSTGAAFTLGGTPALSVYKDNSTTQSTTGVTLTADFDSVTGLNHFAIDTSADGTFYSSGSNFDIVITTGTVDSVSVVGSVVGSFSLQKTSALRPTTAGRTLDVTATGAAGIDWANVENPTTTLALTGTTIATTQQVDVNTIKTNPVVNGGTVTFPTNATLASTTNITAGTITTTTNVTNGVTVTTNNDKTGYSLTQTFPTNFSALSITAGGLVDITQTAADKVWGTATRILTAGTNIGFPTSANIVTELFSTDTETGETFVEAMRLIRADAAGKLLVTGGGTTVSIRDANDTLNRIVATVDSSGQRTAVTVNGA